MPYLNDLRKSQLWEGGVPENAGDLTFILTDCVIQYLELKDDPIRYADLAEVMAAFENAKLEFYRRVVVPYEDKKIEENGDIYEELVARVKS